MALIETSRLINQLPQRPKNPGLGYEGKQISERQQPKEQPKENPSGKNAADPAAEGDSRNGNAFKSLIARVVAPEPADPKGENYLDDMADRRYHGVLVTYPLAVGQEIHLI